MIGTDTDNVWSWSLQTALSDFLSKIGLRPYRIVGYPQVETVRLPNKSTVTVRIEFEMEHDPFGESRRM